MFLGTTSRVVAAVVLVAVIPWCLGCASEARRPQPAAASRAGGTGSLEMSVFENRDDARHDLTAHRTVITELYRVDGQARMLVRRVTEPRWTLSGLAPGRYELRAALPADGDDEARPQPAAYVRDLTIHAGESTTADVVLSGGSRRGRTVALWVATGTLVLVGLILKTRHDLNNMHLLSNFH